MSPDALPDAVFDALSRAAALPRGRPVPWPPAGAPTLDRAALEEEVQLQRRIDRAHDLVIVALAELGGTLDAAVEAELRALARDELAAVDLSGRPGCVDAALQRGVFDGLRVVDGARSVEVDWLRPHLCRGEGRAHLSLRWVDGASALRVRGEVRLPTALARARGLAPGWRARAESALRGALDPTTASAESVGEALLQAMIPDEVGGRAGWLGTRGMELLGVGGARPLIEATRARRTYALSLMSARHESEASSYGALRLVLRVLTSEGGELLDVHEREVYAGAWGPDDYVAPAPSDESVAIAAIDAWRGAARRYLDRPDVRVDAEFLLDGFLYTSRPLHLLATWVAEGPPGPPPVIRPRAALDEGRLAAAAQRARLLDEDEVQALRERVDDQLLAALELDGWTAMFCPCHRPRPGTFQEDRIRIRPPGGAAEAVLMSDPWNGHVMPIDGDAALFRTVARFWRELLERMDVDVAYDRPRYGDEEDEEEEYEEDEDDEDDEDDADEEDEDDDGDARQTSLRAWLEFPLPDPSPPFPAIDWRVYEPDRDFIADFNFWESGPFAMEPELRARYAAAIASHYDAYIRAVIDPDLRPRADLVR